MLILRTLQQGPRHEYGMGQAIRTGSGDVLQAETGSLYPALHRLERHSRVKSEWGQSEKNQWAKYYRLAAASRKQLSAEHSCGDPMREVIARLMKPQERSVAPGAEFFPQSPSTNKMIELLKSLRDQELLLDPPQQGGWLDRGCDRIVLGRVYTSDRCPENLLPLSAPGLRRVGPRRAPGLLVRHSPPDDR